MFEETNNLLNSPLQSSTTCSNGRIQPNEIQEDVDVGASMSSSNRNLDNDQIEDASGTERVHQNIIRSLAPSKDPSHRLIEVGSISTFENGIIDVKGVHFRVGTPPPSEEDEGVVENLVSQLANYSGTSFSSYESLHQFARAMAQTEGFNLSILRSIRWTGTNELKKVDLACYMNPPAKDPNVPKKGCKRGTGCTYRLSAVQSEPNGVWTYIVSGDHNHPAEKDPAELARSRKLPQVVKDEIVKLASEGKRPKEIYMIVGSKFQALHLSYITVKNFYYISKESWIDHGEPVRNLYYHLLGKGFNVVMGTNRHKEVDRIFFSPPERIELLQSFGEVLIMDSTYKTNRNKLALFHIAGLTPMKTAFQVAFAFLDQETEIFYIWTLRKLAEHYHGGQGPKVLVTDKDLALAKAIKKVFPSAKHLLSKWHINRDITKKTKKLSYPPERKYAMLARWEERIRATSESDFDSKYTQFREDFQDCQGFIDYLDRFWIPHKEMFVDAWVNQVQNYGITATSIVEGSHYQLKKLLKAPFRTLTYVVDNIEIYCKEEMKTLRKIALSEKKFSLRVHGTTLLEQLEGKVSEFCAKVLKREFASLGLPKGGITSENVALIKPRLGNLAAQYSTCNCVSKIAFGAVCRHLMASKILASRSLTLQDVSKQWQLQPFLRNSADVSQSDGEVTEDDIDELLLQSMSAIRERNFGCKKVALNRLENLVLEAMELKDATISENRRGQPVGSYSAGRIGGSASNACASAQQNTIPSQNGRRKRTRSNSGPKNWTQQTYLPQETS